MIYGNEMEIGEALKECIPKYVKREDLFITTKLWYAYTAIICNFNSVHDYEEVENGLNCSLKRLGLDYVDLYLVYNLINRIYKIDTLAHI